MRVRSTARTRHGIPSERILFTGFGDFFRILLLLLVDAFTALETQITALDADNSRRRANSRDGWITCGP
jgi:hypothetical protein